MDYSIYPEKGDLCHMDTIKLNSYSDKLGRKFFNKAIQEVKEIYFSSTRRKKTRTSILGSGPR